VRVGRVRVRWALRPSYLHRAPPADLGSAAMTWHNYYSSRRQVPATLRAFIDCIRA